MPPPPRPDSPTFKRLLSLAEQGQRGILSVPDRPAGTRRATIEEWSAIRMFQRNMDEADPTGELRKQGEFFQTFTSKPAEMDYVANHPIHYQAGDKVNPMPKDVFPPGTTEMVHSHPGAGSAFPSPQDYLGTYLINEGGARGMNGILLHAESGRAFAFAGRLAPGTDRPEFHQLTRPSLQDNTDWLYRHGQMQPPAGWRDPLAPPPPSRSPSPDLIFPIDL
jgi:hypothetical protein